MLKIMAANLKSAGLTRCSHVMLLASLLSKIFFPCTNCLAGVLRSQGWITEMVFAFQLNNIDIDSGKYLRKKTKSSLFSLKDVYFVK